MRKNTTAMRTACSKSWALEELETLRLAMKYPRRQAETPMNSRLGDRIFSAGTARISLSQ